MKKRAGILYFQNLYVINEKPNHCIFLLEKFSGDIFARDIYGKSLWSG